MTNNVGVLMSRAGRSFCFNLYTAFIRIRDLFIFCWELQCGHLPPTQLCHSLLRPDL